MNVLRSLTEWPAGQTGACLAMGVFDGVHRGHQALIETAVADARAAGSPAVALTFDPHPIRVLAPNRAPRLLTSTPHKLRIIERLGVDVCLVVTFDRAFAALAPAEFIRQIATRLPGLREICVGAGFRFGRDRAGDIALIQQLAATHGYRAVEIPPVRDGGETISSTAIRARALAGDLGGAAAMLGRPFSVLGTVEPGQQLGRALGFPTANLNPHNEVLPPNGVYAARAQVGSRGLAGVVNIGIRPTVAAAGAERALEIHLLDFANDIYGQDVEVEFVARLRAEQKFASRDELRAQIARDIATARKLLAG